MLSAKRKFKVLALEGKLHLVQCITAQLLLLMKLFINGQAIEPLQNDGTLFGSTKALLQSCLTSFSMKNFQIGI